MPPPTPEDKNAADCRAAISAFVANAELLEAVQAEISKALFKRFQTLVDAGFSEAQAMDIVKARGMTP